MKKPKYAVAIEAGWLCIVFSSSMHSEPMIVSHYWPIRLAHGEDFEYPEQVTEILDHHSGHFSLRLNAYNWREVRLKDGNQTRPIKTEQEEYPKPKTRVETRYRYGHWEKYLKAKGWTYA